MCSATLNIVLFRKFLNMFQALAFFRFPLGVHSVCTQWQSAVAELAEFNEHPVHNSICVEFCKVEINRRRDIIC